MTVLQAAEDCQGTNAAVVTAANSTFDAMSLGGAPNDLTYSNTHLMTGQTTVIKSAVTGFHWGIFSLVSHTRHKHRLSCYVEAIPAAGNREIFYECHDGPDTSTAFQVTLDSAGKIVMRNGTGLDSANVVGSGITCPLNQWFDLELDMDGAANQNMWVYTGATQFSTDHADADATDSGALTATTFSTTQIGRKAAIGTAHNFYFGYLSNITTSETPTPFVLPNTLVHPTAGAATGAGNDGTVSISQSGSPNAGAGAGTGLGYNATALVNNVTNVDAGIGLGTGAAFGMTTTRMRRYSLWRNVDGAATPV